MPGEDGCVLRVHTTDREHGQRRTVDDRVEDVHGQHGLLGLCGAREERAHGDVVGAAFCRRGLLARFPVDGDADDRLRSQDRPRDSRGWIVSSDMNAICLHPAGELRIVVHQKRDSKSARKVSQTATRFGPFLGRVDALVSELNGGDATLEGRGDGGQQAGHGLLR